MDDSASKALGSVLHCIASQSPAHKFPAPKAGNGQKGVQGPAVDWVRLLATPHQHQPAVCFVGRRLHRYFGLSSNANNLG